MNIMKIAWLFPDTLYLHGERGNILALSRFGKLAGFETQVDKIDFNTEAFNPEDYDCIFCPPGEIASFTEVINWLKSYEANLKAFIEEGKPLIVTGTSVGMWTKVINRVDGSKIEGLGILNAETVENENVYGDDNYFKTTYNGREMEIIGNQIQMVDFINHGEEAFGQLIYGYGNSGKDREEGFKVNNSIFTNTLAPMLVCNPWLTEEIVNVVAANKGLDKIEFAEDHKIEEQSMETKKNFILTKVTRLTNCK